MISIVVPVYNAEKYIAETIRMVQAQTCGDWELILVDDCSADGSVACIEAYLKQMEDRDREQIRLIRKERNEGAAAARNQGLSCSQGRFLAFLDADDVWLPDKLEKEMAFMEAKEAAFVFTAYEFGNEKAEGTGKIVTVPERLHYRAALSRTVIFTSTVLFDCDKIDRELLKMPAVESEDTATWWNILRNGYTAWGLNEVTAIYRRPPRSLSANKLTAVRRIWNLYRRVEKLSFVDSIGHFVFWAVRATLRRLGSG